MSQVSIMSAYMWAFIFMAAFLLLAVLISGMIPFKPNDPGTTKRKIVFWVLCVATGIVSFVVNYIIGSNIEVPTIHSNYIMHSGIATGISVLVYIILGFALSKMFPNSKVGTWFKSN